IIDKASIAASVRARREIERNRIVGRDIARANLLAGPHVADGSATVQRATIGVVLAQTIDVLGVIQYAALAQTPGGGIPTGPIAGAFQRQRTFVVAVEGIHAQVGLVHV